MKKLILTSLFTFTVLSAQANETITFAMEPSYAPFETTNEKGEIIGFDVDIAKALCEEIKADCNFKAQSFDSLIAGLKFKKFDAIISAMDITEARAKQISFTDSYYSNAAAFLAVKGKADLSTAKTVGVQNGTTFQQYLTKNAKQYALKPYATLQTAMLDLKSGRIDMIFGDLPVLAEWLKTESDLAFVGEKVTDQTFFGNGFGIGVNKQNTALLAKFNSALNTIKTNGKYEQIYNTWFNQQGE